jgi:hypothetical protein
MVRITATHLSALSLPWTAFRFLIGNEYRFRPTTLGTILYTSSCHLILSETTVFNQTGFPSFF